MTRGESPASSNGARDCHRRAQPRHRLVGLLHVDDAGGELEHRVVALLRPGEDRVPQLSLARDQGRRAPRRDNKADRIRHKRRGRARRRPVRRDPVDRGVGEAGQRHGARIDRLALRIPFVGDRLGERGVGRREIGAARRLHRTPVEQDAVLRIRRRLLVEALHGWGGVRHRRARYPGAKKLIARPIRASGKPRMEPPSTNVSLCQSRIASSSHDGAADPHQIHQR